MKIPVKVKHCTFIQPPKNVRFQAPRTVNGRDILGIVKLLGLAVARHCKFTWNLSHHHCRSAFELLTHLSKHEPRWYIFGRVFAFNAHLFNEEGGVRVADERERWRERMRNRTVGHFRRFLNIGNNSLTSRPLCDEFARKKSKSGYFWSRALHSKIRLNSSLISQVCRDAAIQQREIP